MIRARLVIEDAHDGLNYLTESCTADAGSDPSSLLMVVEEIYRQTKKHIERIGAEAVILGRVP